MIMSVQTSEELVAKKCVPCEGGVPKYSAPEAQEQLQKLQGWEMSHDGQRIRKKWTMKNFVAAISFFNRVADLAEEEQHHPDLHLVGYRNVEIEIWTHAIAGLSENDFILAAKIDELPVETKGR
jgi:4a-hydroxytetrahydrobiopterin dehydratase